MTSSWWARSAWRMPRSVTTSSHCHGALPGDARGAVHHVVEHRGQPGRGAARRRRCAGGRCGCTRGISAMSAREHHRVVVQADHHRLVQQPLGPGDLRLVEPQVVGRHPVELRVAIEPPAGHVAGSSRTSVGVAHRSSRRSRAASRSPVREQPQQHLPGAHALAEPAYRMNSLGAWCHSSAWRRRRTASSRRAPSSNSVVAGSVPAIPRQQHLLARIDLLQGRRAARFAGVSADPVGGDPAVLLGQAHPHAGRRASLDVRRDRGGDRCGVLARHQPAGDVGRRDPCGMTVYAPPPLMPLTSSVGRSRAGPAWTARLAEQRGHADRRRGSPPRRTATASISARRCRGGLGHPVVEAGDRDAAVAVVAGRHHVPARAAGWPRCRRTARSAGRGWRR